MHKPSRHPQKPTKTHRNPQKPTETHRQNPSIMNHHRFKTGPLAGELYDPGTPILDAPWNDTPAKMRDQAFTWGVTEGIIEDFMMETDPPQFKSTHGGLMTTTQLLRMWEDSWK